MAELIALAVGGAGIAVLLPGPTSTVARSVGIVLLGAAGSVWAATADVARSGAGWEPAVVASIGFATVVCGVWTVLAPTSARANRGVAALLGGVAMLLGSSVGWMVGLACAGVSAVLLFRVLSNDDPEAAVASSIVGEPLLASVAGVFVAGVLITAVNVHFSVGDERRGAMKSVVRNVDSETLPTVLGGALLLIGLAFLALDEPGTISEPPGLEVLPSPGED